MFQFAVSVWFMPLGHNLWASSIQELIDFKEVNKGGKVVICMLHRDCFCVC